MSSCSTSLSCVYTAALSPLRDGRADLLVIERLERILERERGVARLVADAPAADGVALDAVDIAAELRQQRRAAELIGPEPVLLEIHVQAAHIAEALVVPATGRSIVRVLSMDSMTCTAVWLSNWPQPSLNGTHTAMHGWL